MERVQSSSDAKESECIFVGANARDDTPILVPRKVFQEHAHILGDTGAGKTTMGLMPLIAQLMRHGDSSVVVIDLKADKQFFFESLQKEALAASPSGCSRGCVKRSSTFPITLFAGLRHRSAGRPTPSIHWPNASCPS